MSRRVRIARKRLGIARAMRKQPESRAGIGLPHVHGVWMKSGWNLLNPIGAEYAAEECPYGETDDCIWIKRYKCVVREANTITAITVEQRGGRWGWVVEVGNG